MSFIEDSRIESIRTTVETIARRESTITDPNEQAFLRQIRLELTGALALGPNTFDISNSASINSIALAHGFVYAGGSFEEAGRKSLKYLARWNGVSWDQLGDGVDGIVDAMAVDGDNLYVVGEFRNAGNQLANGVAKWNGTSWSSLGTGVAPSARPKVIAAFQGDVYVGGSYNQAGGQPVRNLAKWNGNSWSEFEGGTEGEVFALGANCSGLYVGGWITRAGNVAVNQIAHWRDGVWTDMGGGVSGGFNPMVANIAICDDDVYITGRFEEVGGIKANNIAKWNGIGWSNLGLDLKDGSTIFANDTGLYISGDFAGAIGVWDGAMLKLLPDYPLRNYPRTLTGSGCDLYVAISRYESAYNRPDMIAKWNGSAWSLLRGF